ncbi:MAG TPA: very short patch repair endonuclease [Beijerinckiaceae bacterium]|jgi:DNA mismatch endonuclease (patch repair protein)
MDRSEVMRRVRAKNTRPELIVRSVAHKLGYRFRLHRDDLPGKPDLVFPRRRAVVFVNGCFWHGHDCKRGTRIPATNTEYWTAKIARNKARDAASRKALQDAGWAVIELWECQLRDKASLIERLKTFLDRPNPA